MGYTEGAEWHVATDLPQILTSNTSLTTQNEKEQGEGKHGDIADPD